MLNPIIFPFKKTNLNPKNFEFFFRNKIIVLCLPSFSEQFNTFQLTFRQSDIIQHLDRARS